MRAFVKVPLFVSHRLVRVYGKEGQTITKIVEVKAGLKRPLKLTPGQFNLAEKLTYTIKEIEKGRKFQVRFTSIPGPPDTYNGFLKLITNYPEKPEITLRIRGKIQKKKDNRGAS